MSRLDVMALPEFDLSGAPIIITAEWGDGRGHKGVDLGSRDGIEIGTPVHAPADGMVVAIKDDGPFRPPNKHTAGLNIWFLATDGRRWKFFHLNAVTVPINTFVRAGEVIAAVGNSGTIAAHLHWEEHVGSWDNAVNFTANVKEAMASGRWPVIVAPGPTPGKRLSDRDKEFILTAINDNARAIALDISDNEKYLWNLGAIPVRAGDVQIQYVSNLMGTVAHFQVNTPFVLGMAEDYMRAEPQINVVAIAEAIHEDLGDDLAKEIVDAIQERLVA